MINSKRLVFATIKNALVEKANDLTSFDTVVRSKHDPSEILVLGDRTLRVPGPVADGDWRVGVDIDIHAGSVVDDRAETEDVVEFTRAGQRYQTGEKNYFSSGIVFRTDYALKKKVEGSWVEIESFA